MKSFQNLWTDIFLCRCYKWGATLKNKFLCYLWNLKENNYLNDYDHVPLKKYKLLPYQGQMEFATLMNVF